MEIAWRCLLPPQRPYTQTQTHLHFRKSRRLVRILETSGKLGIFGAELFWGFFCHVFLTFHTCFFFFFFLPSGCLDTWLFPLLKVQITWFSLVKHLHGDRRQAPTCLSDFSVGSFRDQSPPPAAFTPLTGLCCVWFCVQTLVGGSVSCCVNGVRFLWPEPAARSSECHIAVRQGEVHKAGSHCETNGFVVTVHI